MTSFRRYFLDKYLLRYKPLMKGKVLDLGGKKDDRRGDFIPPLDQVTSWEYLNNDNDTDPDYCCDAGNIPLADGSIDTVIFTEVLEYLPNPDKVFSEIYRVLRKNGHILLSIPLLTPIPGDYSEARMRYTTVSLKEMCEQAGFNVQSIESMGSVGAVIYDILRVAGGYASNNKRRTIIGVLLPFFRPLFYLMDKLYLSQKDFINTGYFLIAKK